MAANPADTVTDELAELEARVGTLHLRQRLGLEADHETFVFGRGGRFFHLENWYSVHSVIRNGLRLTGLYGRAQRNTRSIRLTENTITLRNLPAAFDGYRILHLSDPHVDMDAQVTQAIARLLREVDYDLCVMTGDYRARTYGPYEATIRAMESLRAELERETVYGVLGNHDSIRMVPAFESMGVRLLINESVALERDGSRIYLAGIDDAHYFRVHSLERAVQDIPDDAISILLSHTPEVYRHAAHTGFDALLCGHTHGGQICLPGGFPLTWDADCPRELAKGAWQYNGMTGYTSVGAGSSIVNARLNCLPEITVHHLRRG
jgi:predicted MPP superfamily phosphohydrolase